MEAALYEILINDPCIKKLVDDRIYPLERPQGSKLPAITYQRAAGLRDYDMDGATQFVESRFLIGFWGEKSRGNSAYKQAKELRSCAVKRFTPEGGFRETIGLTEVQGIFINNEDDMRVDGATGTGATRILLDCTIYHREIEVK